MKHIQLFIIAGILFLSQQLFSQTPQWAIEFPIDNQLNPTMVNSHLVADNQGGFYFIGIKQFKMSYGSQFLGHISISKFDENGITLFPTIEWEGKAIVQKASAFDNGNLLMTGMYFDTLILSNQDSFLIPQNHHFLVIMNSSGEIIHSADMVDDWIDASEAMNNGTYALIKTEFGTFDQYLIRFNSSFQPVDSVYIDNSGFITDLSIDASGNLQIIGSCSNSNLLVNNQLIQSHSGYNAYVVQLDESEEVDWFLQYEDITCNRIDIYNASETHTLISGPLFAPTMIGSDSITGPTSPAFMGTDFYLAAVDSSGVVDWVFDTPNENGNGNFHVARNNSIARYGDGYVILGEFYGDSTIWPGGHSIIDTFNFAYSEGTPTLLFVSEEGLVTNSKLFKGGTGLYLHDIFTGNNNELFISGLINQPAQFDDLTIDADYTAQKLVVIKLSMSTSGIENKTQDANLSIYPNPANDIVDVYFEDPIGSVGNLTLFDATGKLVSRIQLPGNSNSHSLDVSTLNPGVYFIVLEDDQNVSKAKLIVQ
jgi:hypothetical protein